MTPQRHKMVSDGVTVGTVLATVIAGAFVAGGPSPSAIAGATFAVVALLATSELLERRRLGHLIEETAQANQRIGTVLGSTTRVLRPADGVQVVISACEKATQNIRVASLSSKPYSRTGEVYSRFASLLDARAKDPTLNILYLANLGDMARAKRVQDLVRQHPDAANLRLRSFNQGTGPGPLLNFTIIDDSEVVLFILLDDLQDVAIHTRDRDVVAAFVNRFDRLWFAAEPVVAASSAEARGTPGTR